jgi:ABC-type bacteriocin/lantibiotic exporter with double-glycine peptidase domain
VADVSLKVSPGEFIAVVGPSGSGKSTLAKLLLGFLSPSSGSIFLDDRDLRSLHLRCVRQQIGTVLQDGELMHGSIALNILGVSDKTTEEAWEVARLVSLAEDIEKMPMQMHTVISEGAKTISGGQKQRILIARALINRPKILILDEATSALDNKTQAEVQSNLERLTMTRIVIAHRLSTVANADRVVVMSAGRIAQQGKPEEVIRQEGYFQAAAVRQSV